MQSNLSRRDFNSLRAEIGGVHPDTARELLPPQVSIVTGYEPLLVRMARKTNHLLARAGRARILVSAANPEHIVRKYKKHPAIARKRLHFTNHRSPKVSIVIPIYNKFPLTLQCLHSLMRNVSDAVKYEVIVVDNDSKDGSGHLAKVPGLVYIHNEKNEGFVDGCNIGASKAKGEYLVFLNNDAVVTEGWLESLVETIEQRQDVGLVGSKILYMDGRLQEAGGIIYSDGSGSNYGKNDHPDRYQYNYVREVDYCSGASIIIKKSLFDTFGGFDKLYAPAYYEDTDLAFKVRREGLKVLYQPDSVIYHVEGATAGTSTTSGFKRFQAINHKKFLKRWKKTLQSNNDPSEGEYTARDKSGNKLALLVDELVPTPDKDSGSVRATRTIRILQKLGYKVTLFLNYAESQSPYVKTLQQQGIEVVYGPISFDDFISANGKFYDLVILSRPRIASYFLDACHAYCTKAKIAFDTVDLHYLRLGRQAEFEEDKEQKAYYKKMSSVFEKLEKEIMKQVDATIVVSEVEKKILEDAGVNNVHVVSNIHTVEPEAYNVGFDERKDLLFVGGFLHHPNVDAVQWLCNEIFPMIHKKAPDIKLHIVGSHMPPELNESLSKIPGVIVDGFVSDEELQRLLRSSRVFVAPLRYGAGVKGKIGQAIEYGLPIVSTSIGVEAMHIVDNTSGMIAESPKDFCSKTLELYSDAELWASIQINARAIVEDNFSAKAAEKALVDLLS